MIFWQLPAQPFTSGPRDAADGLANVTFVGSSSARYLFTSDV
jgi:hypothetical protein